MFQTNPVPMLQQLCSYVTELEIITFVSFLGPRESISHLSIDVDMANYGGLNQTPVPAILTRMKFPLVRGIKV